MRPHVIAALSALVGVHGIRILQSNDDGWAELYIRSLHEELGRAGHDVVLSAPAENKSGAGKTKTPRSLDYRRRHTDYSPSPRVL